MTRLLLLLVVWLAACLGCGGNECSPPDLIELQRELSLQEDYVRSLQIRVDAIESRMPGGGPALIPASDLPLDAELMEEQ